MAIETVPEILLRLRRQHGLLTCAAAQRAEVDSAQWSRWEHGVAPIPLTRAALIADKLGGDMDLRLLAAADRHVANVLRRHGLIGAERLAA